MFARLIVSRSRLRGCLTYEWKGSPPWQDLAIDLELCLFWIISNCVYYDTWQFATYIWMGKYVNFHEFNFKLSNIFLEKQRNEKRRFWNPKKVFSSPSTSTSTSGVKRGSDARKTNEAIETSVHEDTVQITLHMNNVVCIQYM